MKPPHPIQPDKHVDLPPDRRTFIGTALLGMAVGAPGLVGAAEPASRPRNVKVRGLNPPDAPAADNGYTPGILAEGHRMVFISGRGPKDYDADLETQVRQTLERIKVILEQAGGSMGNIVMLRSYFVNFSQGLQAYRDVRKDYLLKPYPASTAVGVTELAPPGNQIEIEAIAVL